jgi:large subunit ribosomal protein L27e
VAGIERYPLKVTKRMSQKKIDRRSKVKPFVKLVNYNHLIPTRYLVQQEIDLKQVVTEDKLGSAETRKQMKREVRKIFNEKYLASGAKTEKANHVAFFFRKLRF